MVDPQTKPAAVPNRKRVSAEIVDITAPETPVLKKNIKSTPPAVPASASPRVTRSASQQKLSAQGEQAVPASASPRVTRAAAQRKLSAQAKKVDAELKRPVVQAEEATPHRQQEAVQAEEATPERQQEAAQGEQVAPQRQQEAAQGEQAVCRGHLDRKDRRIRIVIPPGKTIPVQPRIASMFATACSLAVKETVRILSHWKDYKGRRDIFQGYFEHVCVSFGTQLSSSFHCYS